MRQVRLRDGSRVSIRPIDPGDKQLLALAFERLSDDSRYRRFLRPMHELSAADLARLTEVDHRDHEALVALAPNGALVGVARYVRADTPDHAEAAITVADDWQGRGLGRTLLERLVERARAERITHFSALVQAENRRALRMLESLGEASSSRAGPAVELDIALPAAPGVGPQLGAALREAALGSLVLARSSLLRLLVGGSPDPATLRPAPTDPIVVGTDGSETSAAAVREAAALAHALGAPLHVVSAYRIPLGGRRDAALDALPGLSATTHVRRGDAASALLDVAEEQNAQLIVVGSAGALGSVAQRVSHHAPCNVLIVRPR